MSDLYDTGVHLERSDSDITVVSVDGSFVLSRQQSQAASPPARRAACVSPFTLARVTRVASSRRGAGDVADQAVFIAPPIRGGLTSRAGACHFGVDIEARDRAPVYAMTSGTITGIVTPRSQETCSRGDLLVLARHADGRQHGGEFVSEAAHRARLAGVAPCHLSQFASCGLVDSRRPVAPRPATRSVRYWRTVAFVANANAYRSGKLTPPGRRRSAGRSVEARPADRLHGQSDTEHRLDTPRHGTAGVTQHRYAAAVRSYLASPLHSKRRIGPAILAFDGSTVIRQTATSTSSPSARSGTRGAS